MFAAFIATVKADGWLVYPECCGHDLVLVAGPAVRLDDHSGIETGDVVAIEGKLRANLAVLSQALPRSHRSHVKRAADWYAVLVPGVDGAFLEIAQALGIQVLVFQRDTCRQRHGLRGAWAPELRVTGFDRLPVPSVQVELTPGQPGPRLVTPWKLGAVRLCVTAASRPGNQLTSADFKTERVSVPSFQRNGWLEVSGRAGRITIYRLLDAPGRPDKAYPELLAALTREGEAL